MAARGDQSAGTVRFVDSREMKVDASPEKAFEPIDLIGGATGWYYADWLWRLRGRIDTLFGGVGMDRGRHRQFSLRVGDKIDCWRVEAYEPNRLLRLGAEMQLAGRGWLEFQVSANGSFSTIRQTATYEPDGLLGRVYWYLAYPFHHLLFRGMLRGIAGRVVR